LKVVAAAATAGLWLVPTVETLTVRVDVARVCVLVEWKWANRSEVR
jgi:hypothetical protein